MKVSHSYLVAVALGLVAPGATFAAPLPGELPGHAPEQTAPASSLAPLSDQIRRATARFRDINVATSEGFVRGTPCVSGPDHGAMGVHLVQPDRIARLVLRAEQPEALIYEPQRDGGFRLVGVEFILLADPWNNQHAGQPPELDGNLFNLVAQPNRYGLPAFYELHVWAWQNNPSGTFADWNTQVSCDHSHED
ncbi:MAG TPA: hypothetical protein VGL55_13885 [Steroidobacteraceae bacterium]|jgi:hypothetical protein